MNPTSLAWSTVAILTLLLPGFSFVVALYLPDKFSRDVAAKNPLGLLAVTVFVSFLSHGALYGLFEKLSHVGPFLAVNLEGVLRALTLGGSPDNTKTVVADFVAHPWLISGYVTAATSIGGALGYFVGWLVARGNLRVFAAHRWVYDLVPDRAGTVPYAFVLADVAHEKRHSLYKGRLVYFGLTQTGSFSYIVLKGIERSFLVLEGEYPRTTQGKVVGRKSEIRDTAVTDSAPPESSEDLASASFSAQASSSEDSEESTLVIDGSNIKHVVFDGRTVTRMAEDEGIVDRALELLNKRRPISENDLEFFRSAIAASTSAGAVSLIVADWLTDLMIRLVRKVTKWKRHRAAAQRIPSQPTSTSQTEKRGRPSPERDDGPNASESSSQDPKSGS